MTAHDWLTAGTGDVSCTRCGALITRPNDPRLTRHCLADDGDPSADSPTRRAALSRPAPHPERFAPMPDFEVSYSAVTTYRQIITAASAQDARELFEAQGADATSEEWQTSYDVDVDDVEELPPGDPGDHFRNHPPLSALPIPTTDQNGYAR